MKSTFNPKYAIYAFFLIEILSSLAFILTRYSFSNFIVLFSNIATASICLYFVCLKNEYITTIKQKNSPLLFRHLQSSERRHNIHSSSHTKQRRIFHFLHHNWMHCTNFSFYSILSHHLAIFNKKSVQTMAFGIVFLTNNILWHMENNLDDNLYHNG